MATSSMASRIDQIGEMAGLVWRTLNKLGPMSMSRLAKEVGQPRDAVMLGLGWLAREEKVWVEEDGRTRVVSLR